MLLVEQAVLRAIGRIFGFARSDTDNYLKKMTQARRLTPWYWARLPVARREGLGELQ